MATTTAPTIEPDTVMTFAIRAGGLMPFLESRPESGPRIKCFEGSVTLVSPGYTHESAATRLDLLILAICMELGIRRTALASTTWTLPFGAGDTAYEADKAYYIQSLGKVRGEQPPDLAIEVVVSHPALKTLRAGEMLRIPEMWVLDVQRERLTFHLLSVRGKHKGTYRPGPRSRAIPGLAAADVLERLREPETDDGAFFENCREWARRVLLPRRG